MVLSILIVPIFSLYSMTYKTNIVSREKEKEFNLARAVCEKFKSENGVVDNKLYVLYANELNDLPISITDIIDNCVCESNIRDDLIKSNNIENKKYAIILNTIGYENVSLLSVKVLGLINNNSEVTLQIAR